MECSKCERADRQAAADQTVFSRLLQCLGSLFTQLEEITLRVETACLRAFSDGVHAGKRTTVLLSPPQSTHTWVTPPFTPKSNPQAFALTCFPRNSKTLALRENYKGGKLLVGGRKLPTRQRRFAGNPFPARHLAVSALLGGCHRDAGSCQVGCANYSCSWASRCQRRSLGISGAIQAIRRCRQSMLVSAGMSMLASSSYTSMASGPAQSCTRPWGDPAGEPRTSLRPLMPRQPLPTTSSEVWLPSLQSATFPSLEHLH